MLENGYQFAASEKELQAFWEAEWVHKFDPNSAKPIFTIDTPPPTVSGNIHIGHIFSYTQAEVIARFKRIMGYNVFYPFGFDDNGLPTERLVEKEIGKKWSEMERKEFVAICLDVTRKYREKFKELWKSVWLSADWDLEYSTISPLAQRVSQRSFLELLHAWKIQRLDAPALWCPECQTSVAQAELEDKEMDSVFYNLAFELEDGSELIIATTRPELLPACVAVFVNPEDERYSHLVGKTVTTPLGDSVKIIIDEKVSINKWTGVVMCCTYGDETDMYWKKQYDLPEKIIIDKSWTISGTNQESVNGHYHKKARKILIEELRAQGKVRNEKPIKHTVNTHERCGTPIEIIPVSQWFIDVMSIKRELLENADKIEWHPEYMKKRYIEWVENLKWDWGISRQRFFGIPTPVWYSKKTGELIVPDVWDLPVDPVTDIPRNLPEWHWVEDIEPDTNILDTWATSALTPQINARWGEVDERSEQILPMDLRPQAHDIIRTWAFYTIAKSQLHRGEIPFKNIMISGHVLAKRNEKISKSKSNAGKTPEELIEQYSADAVRYWACGSALWKDTVLDEKEILKWRKLVNKIWNVLNLIRLMTGLQNWKDAGDVSAVELTPTDKLLLLKIEDIQKRVIAKLENYDFWWALFDFEKFFWNDFCDNYLEIVKDRMYLPERFDDGDRKRLSGIYTLQTAFLWILKLIAPFMPHVSEAVFQEFYRTSDSQKSIHQTTYESFPTEGFTDEKDELYADGELFFRLIDLMRKDKTARGIRLWESIAYVEISCPEQEMLKLKRFSDDIRSISKAKDVRFILWESLTIHSVQESVI